MDAGALITTVAGLLGVNLRGCFSPTFRYNYIQFQVQLHPVSGNYRGPGAGGREKRDKTGALASIAATCGHRQVQGLPPTIRWPYLGRVIYIAHRHYIRFWPQTIQESLAQKLTGLVTHPQEGAQS